MTVDHEHFLQLIQSEPDNPLHRGIYADWLGEQGDERCELLQLAEKVRQFPKGVVHHKAGFPELERYLELQNSPTLTSGWNSQAGNPGVSLVRNYEDWWYWLDIGTVYHPFKYLRQVEALTQAPAEPAYWGTNMTDEEIEEQRRRLLELMEGVNGANRRVRPIPYHAESLPMPMLGELPDEFTGLRRQMLEGMGIPPTLTPPIPGSSFVHTNVTDPADPQDTE